MVTSLPSGLRAELNPHDRTHLHRTARGHSRLLAATQRLHEQLDALQAEKSALERTLQIATERYKSGYSPFIDPLDAQRNLLLVQLAIAQPQADELNAYATLFQALGGGWDRSELESAPHERT